MTRNKRVMYYKIPIKNREQPVFKLSCLFCPAISLLTLSFYPAEIASVCCGLHKETPRRFFANSTALQMQANKKNPRPLKKGFHYLFFYGRGLKNRARNPIIDVLIAYYRFLAARVLADACGIPLEKLQNGFSRISRRMIYLGNPSRRQFPLSSCRYTSAFA